MPVAAIPPSNDQISAYQANIGALKTALAEQDADLQKTQVHQAVSAINEQVAQLRLDNVDVAQLIKPEDRVKLEEAKAFGLPLAQATGLTNFIATGIDRTNEATGVNLSAKVKDKVNADFDSQNAGTAGGEAVIHPRLKALETAFANPPFAPMSADELAQVKEMRKSDNPDIRKIATDRMAMEAEATKQRGAWTELKKSGSLADINCILTGDFDGLSAAKKTEINEELRARRQHAPDVTRDDLLAELAADVRGKVDGISNAMAGLVAGEGPTADFARGLQNAMATGDKGGLAAAAAAAAAPQNDPDAAGATKAGIDEKLPDNIKTALGNLEDAKNEYADFAKRNYSEIQDLINSNLPIEMIVCLVLLKLAERQREKVKLKMQELGAAEAMETAKDSKDMFLGIEEKVKAENPGLAGEELGKKVSAAKDKIQAEHSGRLNQARDQHKIPQMQTAIQSLQFEQNMAKQFMEALSNVLRVIQDMAGVPLRHIR